MNHIHAYHLTTSFLVGSIAYPLLEIAYRGHSHWTMAIAGGVCFAALFTYQSIFEELPFWKLAFLGALSIVTLELFTGIVVNLWLDWQIWDYTDLRFHYLGQISLAFFFLWYALCSLFFWIAKEIGSKFNDPTQS